jgi:hypothetical protein
LDLLFYILLSPLFLAIIIAFIVLARGTKGGVKRPVRSALVIVGVGVLLVVIFYVGWTVMYFAGGGH